MAHKFTLVMSVIVCMCLSASVTYTTCKTLFRNEMIPCTVKRVVYAGDEPASADHGQIARPYTIVVCQPRYHTFIVPGAIGEEDSQIWLTPPGRPEPSFNIR